MASGSCVGRNRKRSASASWSRPDGDTSTRKAPKRQSRLPYKKQRVSVNVGKNADAADSSKAMYRSNISGVIKTVLELDFGEGHIREIRKTPFAAMVDAIRAHNLIPQSFKKCDATVCRIIKTYNPEDEKFHIGRAKLPLRNNDIRLIFGLQCGKDKLDLSVGQKGPSDFMQRRCPNVGRMSSKVIKDLLMEAIRGRSVRDEQDVAKLLCLYICAKLFFATTGEHIGWSFVRVIDKLDTLQQYDWAATIRNTLINSLNEMQGKPERVTGCVVVLLFLICEHSTIVTPERPELTPRFCRWNLGTVAAKLKGVDLWDEGCFEVHCDKLVGTIRECHIIKPEPVLIDHSEAGQNVMDVDPVNEGRNVNPSFNCWQKDSADGGDVRKDKNGTPTSKKKVEGKKMGYGEVWPVLFPDLLELSSTPDGDVVRPEPTGMEDDLENVKMKVTLLEKEIEIKCARVRELEQRVESMEKILGAQAANMLIGFESVLAMKDAKIARLTKMVEQANTRITDLEDSLDDHEVHNVTQSVANSESTRRAATNSRSGDSNGADTKRSSDAAQQSSSHAGQTKGLASPTHEVVLIDHLGEDVSIACADGYVCSSVAGVDCKRNSHSVQVHSDVCDGLCVDVEGTEAICVAKSSEQSSGPKITSLVRRVKEKPRREYRLSDYEYPNVTGRIKMSDKVRICKSSKPGEIYTVEDIDVGRKTWNGFGMSRRHIVWGMLKDEDQKVLVQMYSLEGDGLIVWDGGESGIQVHITDIKDLVQENSIHGNVIDAYGAMLTDMHKTVSGRREYQGTAYVYSSVCADMMRNTSAVSRTKYLNVHTKAARGFRYTVYPIYHANHWTVMVHDSDSGDWKHYNSFRPRRGVSDEHYNEALKVQQWVAEHHNNFVKPRIGNHDVEAEDLNGKLTSVVDCPQQAPESSDCGIFVCFIIRQHIRGADIDNTMDGLTPTTMRAAMVEMFLSSPEKGLRAMAAKHMSITPFFSTNHTP